MGNIKLRPYCNHKVLINRELSLMMASAQVVETSVNTNNSPSQDYTTNPDDHSNHNKYQTEAFSCCMDRAYRAVKTERSRLSILSQGIFFLKSTINRYLLRTSVSGARVGH